MSNLNSRLLVGSIYVLVTIATVLFHQMTGAFYIWLIQAFCLYEFYKINQKPQNFGEILAPQLIGSLIFFMVFINQDDVVNVGPWVWILVPAVLLFFVNSIFTKGKDFLPNLANSVLGWVYISIPLAFLLRMGNLIFDSSNTDLFPYHGFIILLVFILIWVNDSFAYVVGRAIGKRPLAPKLSPKKTIEGFLGGMILTIGAALLIHYLNPVLASVHFIALALICSILGTLGDLFESKIKRNLGLKDSGKMLGGHGGFLDRMDSILFAGPACFFYLIHFTVM